MSVIKFQTERPTLNNPNTSKGRERESEISRGGKDPYRTKRRIFEYASVGFREGLVGVSVSFIVVQLHREKVVFSIRQTHCPFSWRLLLSGGFWAECLYWCFRLNTSLRNMSPFVVFMFSIKLKFQINIFILQHYTTIVVQRLISKCAQHTANELWMCQK